MKIVRPVVLLAFLLGMPKVCFGSYLTSDEWEGVAENVLAAFEGNRRNEDFVRAYNEYIQKIIGFYEQTSNRLHEQKAVVMIYMNAQLSRQYAQDHKNDVTAETRAEAERLANIGTYLVRKHDLGGPDLREDRALFRRSLSAFARLYLRG